MKKHENSLNRRTLKTIDKFDGEFSFLSNFYIFDPPITIRLNSFNAIGNGEITVNNTEAAFQAGKSKEPLKYQNISPKEAKKAGRHERMSKIEKSQWDNYKKLVLMKQLLKLKFDNPDLQQKLIATYPEELIEGNYWHDTYWGVCEGVGENHLGKLLMEIRNELLQKQL